MSITDTMLPPTDFRGHPASLAWLRVRPDSLPPTGITVLQDKKRSSVYGLHGVMPGGGSVVAKRSKRAKIATERAMYEHVLPRLSIPSLRYHGALTRDNANDRHGDGERDRDGEGDGWLFMDVAPRSEYAPSNAAHRALAAEWLGRLHAESLRLAPPAPRLPKRNPATYLALLLTTRELLRRGLENPVLSADGRALLRAVIAECDALESRWNVVQRLTDLLPPMLVHGDFATKNLRAAASEAGTAIVALDWEHAGFGSAAVDLAQWNGSNGNGVVSPDLDVYAAVLRASGVTTPPPGQLRELAEVGMLFFVLTYMEGDARTIGSPWIEKPLDRMRGYRDSIAAAVAAIHWSA